MISSKLYQVGTSNSETIFRIQTLTYAYYSKRLQNRINMLRLLLYQELNNDLLIIKSTFHS